ncbi:MAG: 30S ribosomal protein S8 [Candidatus Bipolaricaulia bacterium]
MNTQPKSKLNAVVSDPVGDMLTRIRNANERYRDTAVMPSSRLKEAIAQILQDEGFITDYEASDGRAQRVLTLTLKYKGGRRRERVIQDLQRVSKPSRRVYVGADEIPTVLGGLGIAILTTSRGILTDHQARQERVGGEVLAYVW